MRTAVETRGSVADNFLMFINSPRASHKTDWPDGRSAWTYRERTFFIRADARPTTCHVRGTISQRSRFFPVLTDPGAHASRAISCAPLCSRASLVTRRRCRYSNGYARQSNSTNTRHYGKPEGLRATGCRLPTTGFTLISLTACAKRDLRVALKRQNVVGQRQGIADKRQRCSEFGRDLHRPFAAGRSGWHGLSRIVSPVQRLCTRIRSSSPARRRRSRAQLPIGPIGLRHIRMGC
jgi:hypothetical protein